MKKTVLQGPKNRSRRCGAFCIRFLGFRFAAFLKKDNN